jgi:hypothetical protein
MDVQKNHIIASLLIDSGLYLHLPGKVVKRFLSGLSKHYPPLYHASMTGNDEEAAIGYEAGWAGIYQSGKEKSRDHM